MILRLNKYAIFIALLVLYISCTKREQKPFSFVQLCDTQLGMGGYEHDLKTFKQAVKQINELAPDFVVICGDLVQEANDSSYSDFKNVMKGFKIPCLITRSTSSLYGSCLTGIFFQLSGISMIREGSLKPGPDSSSRE